MFFGYKDNPFKVKKAFISILLFWLVVNVFGQKQKVNYLTTFDEKKIHFGFTLGYNYLDFAVANYSPISENLDYIGNKQDPIYVNAAAYIKSDVQTMIPGFTVSMISSLRLTEDLDLRFLPGMSFGERRLTYNIPVNDINTYDPLTYYSIKSTYLDFPLVVKYKARRINNDRPYVVFGGAFRQDISKTATEDLVKLKSPGFYAELGGGWDHYFPFFRFSVEGKFSFGLNDQLGPAPTGLQAKYYSQSIKSLRSNIFTLSFHFE
jgi:hypothetical protein